MYVHNIYTMYWLLLSLMDYLRVSIKKNGQQYNNKNIKTNNNVKRQKPMNFLTDSIIYFMKCSISVIFLRQPNWLWVLFQVDNKMDSFVISYIIIVVVVYREI